MSFTPRIFRWTPFVLVAVAAIALFAVGCSRDQTAPFAPPLYSELRSNMPNPATADANRRSSEARACTARAPSVAAINRLADSPGRL